MIAVKAAQEKLVPPMDLFTTAAASRTALAAICREHGVRRLDLFGSQARGAADAEDVDLLVSLDAPTPGAYADAYLSLKERLEALFGRPVDLVTETALRNPYLRRRIIAERVNLFEG